MASDGDVASATLLRRSLDQMLSGFRTTQALYVVTRLGVPDLLKNNPTTVARLAQSVGAEPDALARVLRYLVAQGVFAEDREGRVNLTPLGGWLCSGLRDSLRARALIIGEVWYRAWGELLHSTRTGRAGFDAAFGVKHYDYIARHPELAKAYSELMTGHTTADAGSIVAAYDFSGTNVVVDVGGAHGVLLAAILKAYPQMHGMLFDLPHSVSDAKTLLEAEGVADRCEIIGGSFFDTIPAGGDAYVAKWILEDWDDEHAVAILRNCRRAMRDHARLLVVETLNSPALDLTELVVNGSRLRTEAEYRSIFSEAGFKVTRVIPTKTDGLYIIEGAPT